MESIKNELNVNKKDAFMASTNVKKNRLTLHQWLQIIKRI